MTPIMPAGAGDARSRKRVTLPVADINYSTPAGSAVKWDTQRALALFHSLRAN